MNNYTFCPGYSFLVRESGRYDDSPVNFYLGGLHNFPDIKYIENAICNEMPHRPSSAEASQTLSVSTAPPFCKLILETNHKATPASIKVYLSQNAGVPPVARFSTHTH